MNVWMISAALLLGQAQPELRMPSTDTVETKVSTATRLKLSAGYIAVVEATGEFTIVASPAGSVRITNERERTPGSAEGAITLGGPFAHADKDRPYQGDPRDERRTYTAKQIFSLQAGFKGDAEVLVFNRVDGTVKRLAITVETDANPGPPPGPDVKPEPKDAFAAAVATAFAAESSSDKRAEAAGLRKAYEETAAKLYTFDTWGTLYTFFAEQVKSNGSAGKIQEVQKAVAAELLKTLPGPGSNKEDMTNEGKTKARSAFAAVVKALKAVE